MSTTRALRNACIGVAGLCLAAGAASAQTGPGWEIQLEPLLMDVKGADEHVGDVVSVSTVASFGTPRITEQITHTPIDLNMKGGNTIRAELTYRGRRWGAGVSGWYFRTRDSLSARVSSPRAIDNLPASYSAERNTVLLWSELLPPVRNDLEPSGVSPVEYRASGRLRTYVVDGFALAALADGDAGRLDLIIGGKIARVRSAQDQTVGARAFAFDAFPLPPDFRRMGHFNNSITMTSQGDATVNGAGPMVGLTGRTTWRRLLVEASMTGSLVYASADQSGVFADVDDVQVAAGPSGPFTPCPAALADFNCFSARSDWNFAKSVRAFIPVTDLHLKMLVNITPRFSVGAGSFTSVWTNVPAPPTFTLTHSESGPGLDWDFPGHALRFGAMGAVVRIGF